MGVSRWLQIIICTMVATIISLESECNGPDSQYAVAIDHGSTISHNCGIIAALLSHVGECSVLWK